MNTIIINPVKEADATRVFITVTNDNGQIRCVKIKDISESFDYELSTYPTFFSESDARDFLRIHLEDLLTAGLNECHYFVIVAPYMYNDVPITQYIAFNEKDPSAFIVTDNIKVGTWWESYIDALTALKELPSYLQGCRIRKITIS